MLVPVPREFTERGIGEFMQSVTAARQSHPGSKAREFGEAISAVNVPKHCFRQSVMLPNNSSLFAWAFVVYMATGQRIVFSVVCPTKLKDEMKLFWEAMSDRNTAMELVKRHVKAKTMSDFFVRWGVLTEADVEFSILFATRFPKGLYSGRE